MIDGVSPINLQNAVGIFNINAERRSGKGKLQETLYYFPACTLIGTTQLSNLSLSYGSIVTQNKIGNKENVLNSNPNLARIYYTALGRERYSLYREKVEI